MTEKEKDELVCQYYKARCDLIHEYNKKKGYSLNDWWMLKDDLHLLNEIYEPLFKQAFEQLEQKVKPKCEYTPPVRLYYCPNCGRQLERREYVSGTYDIEEINHCKWCGQALDWSEE